MKTSLLFFIVLSTIASIAQIGGEKTYQFLNYVNSARVEGAGGYLISVRDCRIALYSWFQ